MARRGGLCVRQWIVGTGRWEYRGADRGGTAGLREEIITRNAGLYGNRGSACSA
jgi:hypothetical protein